jgi:hypothetical protein
MHWWPYTTALDPLPYGCTSGLSY